MATSVSFRFSAAAATRARSISEAWVRTTPLAGPVVPDVKNTNAESWPVPRASLGLQEVTLFGGEFAALLQQGGVADKLRLLVVAHAAVLVVDDAANRGTARQYFEQLVDLLLVFGKDVGNVRTLDRRRNLVGRRILIERHHNGAEPVRRAHRRIQARPVVAQQGDMSAALQAARRRGSRKRGGFFGQFAPGYGAPDAAALFTDSRTFTPFSGVMHQQLRKSIELQIPSRHLPRSPMPPQSPWRAERAWRNHPQNVGMQ